MSFDQSTIALDEGVTLELGPLTLGGDGGSMTWSLTGEERAHAYVGLILNAVRPNGSDIDLVARTPSSSFSFFHPSVPAPPLSREATVTFDPGSPVGLDLPAGTRVTATAEVVWAVYEQIDLAISLEGVAVAQVR